MSNESKHILTAQKKIYFSLIGAFAFIMLGICYWLIGDDINPPSQVKKTAELPGDKMDPQGLWMNKVDTEKKLLEQKVTYLENLILDKKKKQEEEVLRINKGEWELRQEIKNLKQELQEVSDKAMVKNNFRENVISQDLSFQTTLFGKSDQENINQQYLLKSPLQELVMEDVKEIKHVDNAIPCGASVKALLVSSVDAPCGVSAQSDPIPVKLRILDDAHLPKHVKAKIKGGIIIASAYGNLSSERVYLRIERLSQINPAGEFVETQVTGFVTGEDGKYGVRGTVVDKSEKIVGNAAISGFLGGISQVCQSAVPGRHNVNENNYNLSIDLIKQGGYGGTSSAFDMLADYYIKRAEQVQPVIQVNAGRVVDITFTLGVELGDINTHQKIHEIRKNYRRNS